MRGEGRKTAQADPMRARQLLHERVMRLGAHGLSRRWLMKHGPGCYGDWPAAVDDLVDCGLIERRVVYCWGTEPACSPKSVAYFPRHRGAG